MEHRRVIYRVAVSGLHCRSAVELVNLKVGAIDGVEAASLGTDHVLTVFADEALVTADDLIRTLIDAGVAPDGEVSVATAAVTEAPVVEVVVEPAPEPEHVAEAFSAVAIEVPELVMVAGGTQLGQVATHVSDGEPLLADFASEPVVAAEPAAVVEPVAAAEPVSADPLEEAVAAVAAPVSPRASLVQRIHVDVADAYYPSRIEVIPGVPVDIEFGEGHGCLSHVLFEQFGIDADLTEGGAVVHLPGLAPGTYGFSCGMRMVFGTVVAGA